MKTAGFPIRLSGLILAVALIGGVRAGAADTPMTGVPVRFHLDRPGRVTLVVEDADGVRVVDLLRETPLPAGDHQVWWDGYADPVVDSRDRAVFARVEPGRYRVRGLVHDGLRLRYEFAISPGTPAWYTHDLTGAWLADHTPPSAVLWLPDGFVRDGEAPDGPALLVGANVAEAGSALMWLRPDGQKLYGMKIDGWMGAKALARDDGPEPMARHAAYAVHITDRIALWGLSAGGAPERIFRHETTNPPPRDGVGFPVGVAAWNGIVLVSNPADDQLLVVDARENDEAGRRIGILDLPTPRGLAFAPDGRLWAVTGGRVVSYAFSAQPPALADEREEVAAERLEDPRHLVVLDDGGVLVSDRGGAHQLKRFDAAGLLVGTIGEPGGPQLGLYDERRMHNPNGFAVTPDGEVWVAEDDYLPKRLSRWRLDDGALIEAFYGGPQYGGGGRPDPRDPTRFYYAYATEGGLEYELDWAQGTARLKAVYVRGRGDGVTLGVPDAAVYVDGRQYLINSYQGRERFNEGHLGVWRMDADHVARLVGVVFGGSIHDWNDLFQHRPDLMADLPEPRTVAALDRHLFAWSDLDGDGRWQPDELAFRAFEGVDAEGVAGRLEYYDPIQARPDLSFLGPYALAGPAPTIRPDGVPVWDLSRVEPRLPLDRKRMDGFEGLHPGFEEMGEGWLVSPGSYNRPHIFGWKDGVLRYSLYGRRHMTSVPRRPGDVIDSTRLLGPAVMPTGGEAGLVLAWNGEKGTIYLFTRDGLFIQTLGGDIRQTPMLRAPFLERGTDIAGLCFEDEHFHPTIQQLEDGRIILVAGKEYQALYRLEGLDGVRRFTAPDVELPAAAVAGLPAERVDDPAARGGKALTVFRVGAGEEKELASGVAAWVARLPESAWAVLDERSRAAAALGAETLYLCFRTGDPDFPRNTAREFEYLFKGGDAYDLMLRVRHNHQPPDEVVEGDLRLLVTRAPGTAGRPVTRATLYRPVVAGTEAGERRVFTSPVGAVAFDRVTEVSDRVTLRRSNGDALIAVPLDVVGLADDPGRRRVRIDLGLLRGDGSRTIRRHYWNNADTSIVSDIPSEARLTPSRWGEGVVRGRLPEAGEVVLLPESAALFGGHHAVSADHPESQIGWWSSPTGGARWRFGAPRAGRYRVIAEYGVSDGDGGDAFTVTVDQPFTENAPTVLRSRTEPTGGGMVFAARTIGEVELEAGPATLELKADGAPLQGRDFLNLARVRLVDALP